MRAKRSIVAISRMIGNALSSNGCLIKSIVIRISTEKEIESASEKSSNQVGIGKMSTTKMQMTPSESDPISLDTELA